MGWPQFVPTSEQGIFARKIVEIKGTMLSRMLKRDQVGCHASQGFNLVWLESKGTMVKQALSGRGLFKSTARR